MARRKKGNPVHGWLVLDKPPNMTSTQAVGAVRRAFDAQKAGHSGTLDPLATGILPIALGEATKTVSFAVDGEKAYRFTVRWGGETDTDDTEGTVTNTSDKRPERGDIEALLPQFHGEIMQVPPAYSAIKVAGERAYDLARGGETVVLESASHLHRQSGARRDDRRFDERVRSPLRQRYVRAGAGPRHGPNSRLLRPRHRIAPDEGRSVRRAAGRDDGDASGCG